MPLTEKEKKYIEKTVGSGGDLVIDAVVEIINKKRDEYNKVEFESISEFLEEIDDFKNMEEAATRTTHIATRVLNNLPPLLDAILEPKKPKEYVILSGKGQAELMQEVRKHIELGWQPFGGASAAALGVSPIGGNQYIQAMVKY